MKVQTFKQLKCFTYTYWIMKAKIIENYMKQCNETGKRPISVFQFCQSMEITESEFYAEFPDLDAIDSSILSEIFENVVSKLKTEEYYLELSENDKLLTVMYAFFEQLKSVRSFLLVRLKDWKDPLQNLSMFKDFRKACMKFISTLDLGNPVKDIQMLNRIVDKGFSEMVFSNILFVLNFWINDRSSNFERTDACIEKSFSLTLNMLQNQTLSKALDFGKFLMQKD